MTKNPLINALAASAYIALVASLMFYASAIFGTVQQSVMIPIAVISLFTLSAAVMGYLFVYAPAELYLEGKKKEGLQLFLTTVGCFALITCLVLAAFLVLT